MALLEGTRSSAEFICKSMVPDVCKSPTILVPYQILSYFNCAVGFSPNVKFRKQQAFHHNSRLSTVKFNEPGVGGGILSGVNLGFCRPVPGMHSPSVRVNGSFVDYHAATYMFMNCAGPEGQFNTFGQVIFLGNMLPANPPIAGKIAKGSFFRVPAIFGKIADLAAQAKSIYDTGKKLYDIAQTDWSDPSSVLGAIGGLAGIAELQKTVEALETAKKFYDLGEKVVDTDWSDPKQALGTIAGLANVANMPDIAKAAEMASSINDAINTDWEDPRAAIAAATGIFKSSGLDTMAIEMANKSGIDLGFVPPLMNHLPHLFPLPGSSSSQQPASQPTLPPQQNPAKPAGPLTKAAVDELQQSNSIAYERYQALPQTDATNAAGTFVEFGGDLGGLTPASNSQPAKQVADAGSKVAAIYIPGNQPAKPSLQGADWNGSTPSSLGLKEIFVAQQTGDAKGDIFGIREKAGEVYLFGGTVNQNPEPSLKGSAPGKANQSPGNVEAWWVSQNALGNSMAVAQEGSSDESTGAFSDITNFLMQQASAFQKGEPKSPLRLPINEINGRGVSLAGTMAAVKDSVLGVKDELTQFGTDVFDSVGDFYNDIFGDGEAAGELPDTIAGINGPIAVGDSPEAAAAGGSGGGSGGGGAGAGAAALPAAKPKAGEAPPSIGVNGILVTITQGNPAAMAAAIEASMVAANTKALSDAQAAEEEAKKEEKARPQKDEQYKSPLFIESEDEYPRPDHQIGIEQAVVDQAQKKAGQLEVDASKRYEDASNQAKHDKGLSDEASRNLENTQSNVDEAQKRADDAEAKHKRNSASAQNTREYLESRKSATELADARGELGARQRQLESARTEAIETGRRSRASQELLENTPPKNAIPRQIGRGVSTAGKFAGPAGDGIRLAEGALEAEAAHARGDGRGVASAVGGTAGDIVGGTVGGAGGAAVGAVAGAKTGVLFGSLFGPPGIVVGGAIGGAIGAVGGAALGGYGGSVAGDAGGRVIAESAYDLSQGK